MNHFEAATATEQQKGIAQKETLLSTQRVIGIHPTEGGGWGRRSNPETSYSRLGAQGGWANGLKQDPADYPGIWVINIIASKKGR
jgi:hypothetical protein